MSKDGVLWMPISSRGLISAILPGRRFRNRNKSISPAPVFTTRSRAGLGVSPTHSAIMTPAGLDPAFPGSDALSTGPQEAKCDLAASWGGWVLRGSDDLRAEPAGRRGLPRGGLLRSTPDPLCHGTAAAQPISTHRRETQNKHQRRRARPSPNQREDFTHVFHVDTLGRKVSGCFHHVLPLGPRQDSNLQSQTP